MGLKVNISLSGEPDLSDILASVVFLQALRDVVEAQGGMTRAAHLAGLNRESLYRQLSRRGNPSMMTFSRGSAG
jgi:DNA-binding phage protein